MEKPSFVSFEPEQSEINKMSLRFIFSKRISFILILLGLFNQLGLATAAQPISTVQTESSSPPSEKDGLDTLPTYNVQLQKDLTDASSIRVGDQLELIVNGIQFSQIEEISHERDVEDEGWLIHKMKSPSSLIVIPSKGGRLTLPPLLLKDAEGKPVGRTHPFLLEVQSAITKKDSKLNQSEQIIPPVELTFPIWMVIAISVAILALVIGVGIWIYRRIRSRRPKPSKVPEVIRSEDEIALSELAEVEKQDFLKKGNYKGYYFRISEILKVYVGDRYRFDAPECTTREMIRFLEDKKTMSDSLIDRLESIFERLDRVKFTDHFPSEKESKELLFESVEFVKVTRRPPMTIQPAGVSRNAT